MLGKAVRRDRYFGVLDIVVVGGKIVVGIVVVVDMLLRLDMLMLVKRNRKVVLVRQHMMGSSSWRVV